MKHCPYDKRGCMFLHEDTEPCKFGGKCTNKLCKLKHLDNDESDDDETTTDDEDIKTDDDEANTDGDEGQNVEDEEIEALIFTCEKCDHSFPF